MKRRRISSIPAPSESTFRNATTSEMPPSVDGEGGYWKMNQNLPALNEKSANLYISTLRAIEGIKRNICRALCVDPHKIISERWGRHGRQTGILAGMIVDQLTEDRLKTRKEIESVIPAGIVHDTGKVDKEIFKITKIRGGLSADEWKIMETHAKRGAQILVKIQQQLEEMKKGPFLPNMDEIIKITLGHHERLDGSGYNIGLDEEHIPFPCQILAVADTISAMTQVRGYNESKNIRVILAELKRCSGNAEWSKALTDTELKNDFISRGRNKTENWFSPVVVGAINDIVKDIDPNESFFYYTQKAINPSSSSPSADPHSEHHHPHQQ